jgi:uncharacterized phage protein (TIGR01671 family)
MNEEMIIKYRVWDIDRKEMKYPGWEDNEYVRYEDDTTMQKAGYFLLNQQGKLFCNDGIVLDDWNDSYKIMFFTGRKDKNGKEIYNGDIVKWETHYYDWNKPDGEENIPITRISHIVWRNVGFWVEEEHFGWEGESMWKWDELEVIGNIYENEKLLKQQ